MKTEDAEALGRQRAKPSKIKVIPNLSELLVPLCIIITVHNTVTQRQFFSILSFLQTNITSQMWPSGGKVYASQCHVNATNY